MRQLKGIWSLAALDLLLWRRMPLAVVSALLPPLGMALLIVVLTLTVTQEPVALVVESKGQQTDRMSKLIQSDDEAYALTVTSRPEADALLKKQRIAAIITIPPGFDQAVSAHTARLNLILNNIDIDFSDDIRRSVERSVGQFNAPQLGGDAEQDDSDRSSDRSVDQSNPDHPDGEAETQEGADMKDAGSSADAPHPDLTTGEDKEAKEDHEDREGADVKAGSATAFDSAVELPNPYHIAIQERDLRVTNVDFLHYQVLPVLILLVLNVGLMGTSLLCAADRERGTARLLVLAPFPAWVLVAGRLLGGLIASLAVLLIAVGLCLVTHTLAPPANHWSTLTALFVCTALCASGMGAMLGTLLRGQRNIAMAACILATYLFFMGGGFTTIAYLPAWLRDLSRFDPIRYAIDGMRQALFYPDLTGLPRDLIVLTGAAVAAALLGSLMVTRSWRA